MHKYLMYTILTKQFHTALSGEYKSEIGGTFIPFKPRKTKKEKMGKLKLESYFLSKQKPTKKTWW